MSSDCSARMTGSRCLQHRWLNTGSAVPRPHSKAKLKRYVIKKRWLRIVNTIIALRRMGAELN